MKQIFKIFINFIVINSYNFLINKNKLTLVFNQIFIAVCLLITVF